MTPFDFVVAFLSFIYTLALTHLLLSVARMVRFRRKIRFSIPHLLWMLCAVTVLVGNWTGLWDLHATREFTLGTITIALFFAIVQYVFCALVSPEFDEHDGFDLTAFHRTQYRTWAVASFALMAAALVINVSVTGLGLNWVAENALVLAMMLCAIAVYVTPNRIVQIVAPLILLGLLIAAPILYSPVIK